MLYHRLDLHTQVSAFFHREFMRRNNVSVQILNDPTAVYVLRVPGEGDPGHMDFAHAGYAILKSLCPAVNGKVLIKPNMIPAGETDAGLTTHPQFVGGMVDFLREIGVREIAVGEGGWGGRRSMDEIWQRGGYTDLAEEKDIELVDLNLEGVVTPVPDARFTETLNISARVMDEDTFVIDTPKMKTHNLAVTTLCMKNLMGTVLCPDRHFCGRSRAKATDEGIQTSSKEEADRFFSQRYEQHFGEILTDLASVLKPDLCVIEGVMGRDGTAFHRGSNIPSRIVVAGTNAAVVDAFTSYIMGFDPTMISYLQEANRRGIGTNDLSQIKVYEAQNGTITPVEDKRRLFMGTFELISYSGEHRPELYVNPPTTWKYEENHSRHQR